MSFIASFSPTMLLEQGNVSFNMSHYHRLVFFLSPVVAILCIYDGWMEAWMDGWICLPDNPFIIQALTVKKQNKK